MQTKQLLVRQTISTLSGVHLGFESFDFLFLFPEFYPNKVSFAKIKLFCLCFVCVKKKKKTQRGKNKGKTVKTHAFSKIENK